MNLQQAVPNLLTFPCGTVCRYCGPDAPVGGGGVRYGALPPGRPARDGARSARRREHGRQSAGLPRQIYGAK